MKEMKIKEKEGSAIEIYIRSSYIPPNWNDMRSIADITELSDILLADLEEKVSNYG